MLKCTTHQSHCAMALNRSFGVSNPLFFDHHLQTNWAANIESARWSRHTKHICQKRSWWLQVQIAHNSYKGMVSTAAPSRYLTRTAQATYPGSQIQPLNVCNIGSSKKIHAKGKPNPLRMFRFQEAVHAPSWHSHVCDRFPFFHPCFVPTLSQKQKTDSVTTHLVGNPGLQTSCGPFSCIALSKKSRPGKIHVPQPNSSQAQYQSSCPGQESRQTVIVPPGRQVHSQSRKCTKGRSCPMSGISPSQTPL